MSMSATGGAVAARGAVSVPAGVASPGAARVYRRVSCPQPYGLYGVCAEGRMVYTRQIEERPRSEPDRAVAVGCEVKYFEYF